MQRCNNHLAYFGQGTFIELKLRTTLVSYKLFGVDQPVEIEEKRPVVIGTLTCEEDVTLDILLDQTPHLPKETEKHAKSEMQVHVSQKRGKRNLRSNTQTLAKHNKDETDLLISSTPHTKKDTDLQTTTVHDDSDSTIIYDYQAETKALETKTSATGTMEKEMNLNDKQSKVHSANIVKEGQREHQVDLSIDQNMRHVKILLQKLNTQEIMDLTTDKKIKTKSEQRRKRKLQQNTKNMHAPAVLRKDTSGKTPKFTLSTYKLSCKKKRNYTFHCAVRGCRKSFNKVKDWNSHHLLHHRSVKYKCSECSKWISTPTGLKDHKYMHHEKCFRCGRCEKTFYFQSGLNLHRNLHRRKQAYECFTKNCKKCYKWPQDLMRHIKMHLDIKLKCVKCEYVTHEARLFKQHEVTHSKHKKFICRQRCASAFKHAMQHYRHEQKCK